MKLLLIAGLVCLLVRSSIQQSNPSSPTYRAAVAEFHAVSHNEGETAANFNAKLYKRIIEEAAKRKIDIIVFPEYGLTSLPETKLLNATEYRDYFYNVSSYSPEVEKQVVLCSETDPRYKDSLKSMSCAAKNHRMYIVVNHFERADCPQTDLNCSDDGILLYNTNFVFDRNGRLISRYRESNLYNEPGTNVTKVAEISTFTTDFNVTFGQIICADIIRAKPTLAYVKNPNVTDVVMSSHWFDDRPFFQSLEYQAGWAYSSDANLLVSGFSNPSTGTTGSGFYAGKHGVIKAFRTTLNRNALIMAEIPKLISGKRDIPESKGKHLWSETIIFKNEDLPAYTEDEYKKKNEGNVYSHQQDLRVFTTELINPSFETPVDKQLCNRDMCCDFHVETIFDSKVDNDSDANYYRYRLAVFNGVRPIGNETSAGFQICGIISCTGLDLDDCNKEFPPNTEVLKPIIIQKLTIARTDVNLSNNRSLYMPFAINRKSEPLNTSDFTFTTSGELDASWLILKLTKPRDDIMDIGIVGRKFDRDGRVVTAALNGAVSLPASFFAISFIVACLNHLIKLSA